MLYKVTLIKFPDQFILKGMDNVLLVNTVTHFNKTAMEAFDSNVYYTRYICTCDMDDHTTRH